MQKEYFLELTEKIKKFAKDIGISDVGITSPDLPSQAHFINQSINSGFNADMHFIQKTIETRLSPKKLMPDVLSIISVKFNYFPYQNIDLKNNFISLHALGDDYHKIILYKLRQLAKKIEEYEPKFKWKICVDSSAILEKLIAERAGLGWIGKNTLLISKEGSFFCLGEILTNLPLVFDSQSKNHCGSCNKCITECPTGAIVNQNQLNANLCISYHTIENKNSIPIFIRPLIGKKIFGCDQCQLCCPWNRFAIKAKEDFFKIKDSFEKINLIDLFLWSEEEFLINTEGSVLRRLGYERWLRNIAVALGNCDKNEIIIKALQSRLEINSDLVREHVLWALKKQCF